MIAWHGSLFLIKEISCKMGMIKLQKRLSSKAKKRVKTGVGVSALKLRAEL